jgi:hypothetical protein
MWSFLIVKRNWATSTLKTHPIHDGTQYEAKPLQQQKLHARAFEELLKSF